MNLEAKLVADILNHCAAGYVQKLKILLDQHSFITELQSFRDEFGNTLLMLATFWNRRSMARFLLQDGSIDVNAVNQFGHSALMVACEKDYRPMIELLIEAGANVNHSDNCGRSVLIRTCREGRFEVVAWLLARHPQLAASCLTYQDLYGRTVLHYVCLFGHGYLLYLFLSLPAMCLRCLTIRDHSTGMPALYPSKVMPIYALVQTLASALTNLGPSESQTIFQQYSQFYRDEASSSAPLMISIKALHMKTSRQLIGQYARGVHNQLAQTHIMMIRPLDTEFKPAQDDNKSSALIAQRIANSYYLYLHKQ